MINPSANPEPLLLSNQYWCVICELLLPKVDEYYCSDCGNDDSSMFSTHTVFHDLELDDYLTYRDLGEGDS